ncbi:pyrrolysine--tRNA(Pyl) ligase small subunit [Clostridium sp. WILCCON 0269]|uniref:Pyrrolysine--tRNA(Pyl) ligase small subunit n=1 Tax=Candidatus Clostridium eludens TaxID=3381663 RepID=A0ABW8SFG2_9CLOT
MNTIKNTQISTETKQNKKKKYYRKNVNFFKLIEKIKLWPSRSGVLHGIKSIEIQGNRCKIVTHCNMEFQVWSSKKSRAARWLRNKWAFCACGKCGIPDWKLEKYSSTVMTQKWGSGL